ncbi:hypothetical protein NKH77_21325 [Streptomyces sp. M19]
MIRYLTATGLCGALRTLRAEPDLAAARPHLTEMRRWAGTWCTESLLRGLAAPTGCWSTCCARALRRPAPGPGDRRGGRGARPPGRQGAGVLAASVLPRPGGGRARRLLRHHRPAPGRPPPDFVGWRDGTTLRLAGRATVEGVEADAEDRAEVVLRERAGGRNCGSRSPPRRTPTADRPRSPWTWT